MRQSHLYLIAAILFVIATGLNLAHDGFGLKTVLGTIFVMAMLAYRLHLRRAGR
jgi:hypothetical protein